MESAENLLSLGQSQAAEVAKTRGLRAEVKFANVNVPLYYSGSTFRPDSGQHCPPQTTTA